jgi:hypothetical protein
MPLERKGIISTFICKGNSFTIKHLHHLKITMFPPKTNLEKTSISLKMLLEVGLIQPGQEVSCGNQECSGSINSDGSLRIIFKGNEKNFPYLSGAARYVEKRSINGWLYWFVVENGQITTFDDLRQQYLVRQER